MTTEYEKTPFQIKEIEIIKILTEDNKDIELNQKNIEIAKQACLKNKDYLQYRMHEGFYDPKNYVSGFDDY